MKKLIAAFLPVILLLTGCAELRDSVADALDSTLDQDGSGSAKIQEDTTLHNGYTGISVTVPAGYYITYQNEDSMTATPGESADPNLQDFYEYGDGGYAMDLVGFQSHRDDGNDNHSEYLVYVEEYDLFSSFDEYVDYFAEMAEYSSEGFDHVYRNEGTATLAGRQAYRLTYSVTHPDNGDNVFLEDYYLFPLPEVSPYLYFVGYINYWETGKKSGADCLAVLDKALSLSGGSGGGAAGSAGNRGDTI